MRKHAKQWLCLLMTLALMLCLVPMSVSADNTYRSYTILGDSITSGFSVTKEGSWDANLVPDPIDYKVLQPMVNVPDGTYSVNDIQGMRNLTDGVTYRVHGSYPDLVGNGIGIPMPDDSVSSYANLKNSGFKNLSLPGLRSVEMRMLVDPSYAGDDICDIIWDIVQPEGLPKLQQVAREYIQSSDLITINIGSNDVAINCLIRALNVLSVPESELSTNELVTMAATGNVGGATLKLMETAYDMGKFPLAAAAYLQGLVTGVNTFNENWDPIINAIHTMNPNARILAVGFYNPFKTFALTDFHDDLYLGIGHSLDILMQTLVTHVTTDASTRQYYEYVDIWDTEVIGLQPLIPGLANGSYLNEVLYDVHPTNAGHKYIAEQILKVINNGTAPSPEPTTPAITGRYVDVTSNDWFKSFVDYVSDRGIMTGVTNNTFEPYSNLTRAQVATILYALEGKPANTNNAFADVVSGSWYYDPINWCASKGIVAGTGNGLFEPDRNVTREELATMLRGYAGYFGGDTASEADISGFNDASSVSDWATGPMRWAVAKGLISGRPGNLLAPQGTATRAEMAVVMKNFCEVYGK